MTKIKIVDQIKLCLNLVSINCVYSPIISLVMTFYLPHVMMNSGEKLGGLLHNSLHMLKNRTNQSSRRIRALSYQILILKIEANGGGFYVLDFKNFSSVG